VFPALNVEGWLFLIDVTRQLEPLGKTKESIDFNDSFAVV
jgi:hypothetical protein